MIRSGALILLLTLTATVACGDDDPKAPLPDASNGGAPDASNGGSVDAAEEIGFVTALRLCTEFANTWCDRRGFCAAPDIFPVEECKVNARDACVGSYPSPDSETMTTEAELQTCVSDIEVHDCNEVRDSNAPTSCTSLE